MHHALVVNVSATVTGFRSAADRPHRQRREVHRHRPAVLQAALRCAAAVIAEIRRVLKPGGIIGVNEFTFQKLPPASLVSLLTGTMGIHTFRQDTWESILRSTGFAEVTSSVHRIDLWEQLASHLEADGLKNYLAAMVVGVGDTSIRRTFFDKEMLLAARDFLPYVGCGLYTGRSTVEEPFRV
jgi:SAM-dependent methyltransferase